jgi:hypothetical protein
MSRGMSAVPHRDPRGRRRPVGWHRAATLEPKYRELHAWLISEGRPLSGRCGGYVYSWFNGRLHWRRYVLPTDPRTPAQQRSQAAFRAASVAWSQYQPLSHAQRDAWRASAAKIKSRPRLGAWGFLTAQQHFVGNNSLKDRWGLPLLLEPREKGMQTDEGRIKKAELRTEARQARRVTRSTSGSRRTCAVSPLSLRRAVEKRSGKPAACRVPTQVANYQPLTRPSSERHLSTPRPLLVQRRWQTRSASRLGGAGCLRWSSTLAQIRPNARCRELWRGG